jgi:hypothetical protein
MVPCPHCNAPLFGNPLNCYKCGKPIKIDDHTEEEIRLRREKEESENLKYKAIAEDPKLKKRYLPFTIALETGRAGIATSDSVVEGAAAWAYFANQFRNKRYTALKCSSCGYVLLREFVSNDGWITRNEGTAIATNWIAWFKCPKCGTDHRRALVSVSYDAYSAFLKNWDPVAEIYGISLDKGDMKPWWKFW